jgi:cholest-4-en-3-one 26-monooxygenase
MQIKKRNATAVTSIEKDMTQKVFFITDHLAGDFGMNQRETHRFVEGGCFLQVSAGIGNVVKTRHMLQVRTAPTWKQSSGAPNVLLVSSLDLLDPYLWQSNPHEVWRDLRANDPVHHDKRNGLFGITRHADVLMVERRADLFPSAHSYRAIPAREEMNMIAQDDPGHRTQRMLVQRFFAPGAVARRESEIRAIVTELLDAALAKGSMEVINDLAGQLPARLTCRLMGFPEELWPKLKEWSERLMRTDMHQRDGQTAVEFMMANLELFDATKSIIDEHRARPQAHEGAPDLLAVWANANVNGTPMDLRTIYHESGLFVSGGSETTRTTIAHGLSALIDHPDQWDAIATDPSLVSGAVEEIFRWVTPLNNFFRVCMKPTEVSGTQIGMGDRVIMIYPSANRDEALFDDPYTFDVRRTPNHHLSFGNGPHMCVGAPLARLTMRVLLEEMTRRISRMEVVTEPEVEANIFARAVAHFEVSVSAR